MFTLFPTALFILLAAPAQTDAARPEPAALVQQLRSADRLDSPDAAAKARETLEQIAKLSTTNLTSQQRRDLVAAATDATGRLLRDRVRPTEDGRFTVYGRASDGGNGTLQSDLRAFTEDAERLERIARNFGEKDSVRTVAVQNREVIDRYHR